MYKISLWQPVAKVAVGFVQAWMIFELAMRIKYFSSATLDLVDKVEESQKMTNIGKLLKVGQYLTVSVAFAWVISCMICLHMSVKKDRHT